MSEITFADLPLSPSTQDALRALGYTHPTPVQKEVLERAAAGKDLVVQARTGSGKTAAFGIPIVDRLVRTEDKHVQVLALTPTRELALQVSKELEKIGAQKGVRVTTIYGGAPMGKQIAELESGTHVVVGTPGRVLDHLNRGTLHTDQVRILVLDEADEMLSMGFAKDLYAICERLPKSRQGLFFSATLPPGIEDLARRQLKEPEFVTLSSDQVGALEISHHAFFVNGDKRAALLRILSAEKPESAILFCNTKDETERVSNFLKQNGYLSAYLNGDMDQKEREKVMSSLRDNKVQFLVATDVAARGIDISHLTHVINFDFPDAPEVYVHRTGRTGRAGRTGTAFSLVGPKEIGSLYMVRLLFKIRPNERFLPSDLDLQSQSEADRIASFAQDFAHIETKDEYKQLAKRLLTHDDAEGIIGGLLQSYFGTRVIGEGVSVPPPRAVAANPIPTVAPQRTRERQGERPPRESRDARDPRPQDRPSRDTHDRAPREPRRAPRQERSYAAPQDRDASHMESRTTDAAPANAAHLDARVFVNVGRKDGLRADDILGWLQESGFSREDVGNIRINERITFVPVPKEKLEVATKAISGKMIRDRVVVAEPAKSG